MPMDTTARRLSLAKRQNPCSIKAKIDWPNPGLGQTKAKQITGTTQSSFSTGLLFQNEWRKRRKLSALDPQPGYLLVPLRNRLRLQLKGAVANMKIMAKSTFAEPLVASPVSVETDLSAREQPEPSQSALDADGSWNVATVVALLLLVVLWALKLYTTWGAWGNLTVDSGREMYVPQQLAEGKQLYRDVWFLYGPAAPYLTSYLYRLFGANLNVLYWTGSLSALGSAIFLYLTGMRLSSWVIGWTAGAVVLMEAFQPSLFCFPLPYASASVYGCFTACLFLWLVARASFSREWFWMLGAGTVAALALLLKLEFGIACYGTLALLVAARGFMSRSWAFLAKDVAAVFPGMVLCGVVIRWMVSIGGVEFITQENMMSWPTTYFMRTYGKSWLERNGFTVSGAALLDAFYRAVPVAAVILVLCVLLRWRRSDMRSWLSRALMVLALALYFIKNNYFLLSMKQSVTLWLSTIFFPQDMVLYVILGAIASWCYFWWRPSDARRLAISLLLTCSGLLAFRTLMKMRSGGYSIYYNGPVVLSFLLLVCLIIPRSNRTRRFVLLAESVLCLACLTPVWSYTRANEAEARDFVPLVTARGTVRVSKHMVESYTAAIQFMKEKAERGESVLSVPEDTSLYFLSGVDCPTRVFAFTPGLVSPGKMADELIQEIGQKRVRYLLWSNREFPEYGAARFGIDFNPELGDYFKANFHRGEQLAPGPEDSHVRNFVVWERNSEGLRP